VRPTVTWRPGFSSAADIEADGDRVEVVVELLTRLASGELDARDEHGRPLCSYCRITDPANRETCLGCSRRRPVSVCTPDGRCVRNPPGSISDRVGSELAVTLLAAGNPSGFPGHELRTCPIVAGNVHRARIVVGDCPYDGLRATKTMSGPPCAAATASARTSQK
jgi:hypothetical protein